MTLIKKKSFLKIFIVVFFLVALSILSYARIIANYSECAFEGQCERALSISISNYIVESAGYFLKSHSDIILFHLVLSSAFSMKFLNQCIM